MRVPDGSRVVADTSHVSSDLGGGERVLLSIERGLYYGLDEVGSFIWEMIQAATTVDEIRAAVLTRFDVDEERVAVDVDRFLGELIDGGLATVMDVEDQGVHRPAGR